MPEARLSIVAGAQDPVMPLLEVVGREGTAAPAQTLSEVPKLKEGVILGLTETEKLAVVAHCPAVGVKV